MCVIHSITYTRGRFYKTHVTAPGSSSPRQDRPCQLTYRGHILKLETSSDSISFFGNFRWLNAGTMWINLSLLFFSCCCCCVSPGSDWKKLLRVCYCTMNKREKIELWPSPCTETFCLLLQCRVILCIFPARQGSLFELQQDRVCVFQAEDDIPKQQEGATCGSLGRWCHVTPKFYARPREPGSTSSWVSKLLGTAGMSFWYLRWFIIAMHSSFSSQALYSIWYYIRSLQNISLLFIFCGWFTCIASWDEAVNIRRSLNQSSRFMGIYMVINRA